MPFGIALLHSQQKQRAFHPHLILYIAIISNLEHWSIKSKPKGLSSATFYRQHYILAEMVGTIVLLSSFWMLSEELIAIWLYELERL